MNSSDWKCKFLSLFLCIIVVFSFCSWNIEQAYGNPIAIPAGRLVGALLVGMGVVAAANEDQEVLGNAVFESLSEDTQNTVLMMAALVVIGQQQAIKLSEGLYNDLKSTVSPWMNNGAVIVTAYTDMEKAIIAEVWRAFSSAAVTNKIIRIETSSGSFLWTIDLQSTNGSNPGYLGPYSLLAVQKVPTAYGFGLSLTYRYSDYVTWMGSNGPGELTVSENAFPWGATDLLINGRLVSLGTSISLNPDFQVQDGVPDPFNIPLDSTGSISIPAYQDAVYEGVTGVVSEDIPFQISESVGSIQGDVGVIKGILSGVGSLLGSLYARAMDIVHFVSNIGQILSNILNKILEMLAVMVAFFQAIIEWVNSFFSDLALTIEAALTKFFTIPPFTLPVDMIDDFKERFFNKLGVSAFNDTFNRLKNIQTGYGSPPRITINLHKLMAATSGIGSGFTVPFPDEETLIIDFSKLEEVEFWGMSLINVIRSLITLSMVSMTFNAIYRKIIPDKVLA